jgi:two-component system, chemotaxis family, sensor kinase CheA
VQEKVERLGGSVTVEAQPGLGTTFRMTLPLTLATFRGIHVLAGGRRFVLPTTRVQQVLRVKRRDVKSVAHRPTIRWGGQVIALVQLAEALGFRATPFDGRAEYLKVLIVGAAERRVALAVDEVLEESEVLVKALRKPLVRVRNIAGATLLGSGEPVPILEVGDLVESALQTAAAPTETEAPTAPAEKTAALVAEDSITSRALLKGILESAGYEVSTAVDGAEAFGLLKAKRFDIVVSDIEMPRMNGFELTARIRADSALSGLPVVLVTALDSPADREKGMDVGASAYIVKSSFDQSNLLEVMRQLA